MISTGNDIVALDLVDVERTKHVRFYSQILSDAEQELYQLPIFPQLSFDHYVWLLWSVKESAYKYLKRLMPQLVFSPTKLSIQDLKAPNLANAKTDVTYWECSKKEELYSGIVSYQSYTLYFRSKISANWIATVVGESEDPQNIQWGVRSIEKSSKDHQSIEVRRFLTDKLKFYYTNIRIAKSQIGYPIIFNNDEELNIPVSFAHHGNYISYSFVLDPGKITFDGALSAFDSN